MSEEAEKEKKELEVQKARAAFWQALGSTPDPIPEFKLPDLKGQYPEREEGEEVKS